MKKILKQAYTTEFKELAVKRVTDGHSITGVVTELGLSDQTLSNWVKAAALGKVKGTGTNVINALTMAWFRRKSEAGVMHHSDRGSQYTSHAFQDKHNEFGMTCSMSRKGNC